MGQFETTDFPPSRFLCCAIGRSPLEIELAVYSVLLVHKPVFPHKSRVREKCEEVRKVEEGERVPRTEPPSTRAATGVAPSLEGDVLGRLSSSRSQKPAGRG